MTPQEQMVLFTLFVNTGILTGVFLRLGKIGTTGEHHAKAIEEIWQAINKLREKIK